MTGSLRPVLLGAAFGLCAGTVTAKDPDLAPRLARLACGNTLVTAQAACYGATAVCASETLTFHRPEARTIVASHRHRSSYPLAGGTKVEALDYHAAAWACADGAHGGRYLAIVMAHTGGGNCSTCEFLRLYHSNGRLIASTLRFDAAGRPLEDAKAGELIREMLGTPVPDALRPVYGR